MRFILYSLTTDVQRGYKGREGEEGKGGRKGVERNE